MPGYNLQVDGHEIQNLKVEPDRTGLGGIGGAITGEAPKRFKVSGTYAIDVKNTGITPALFASVNIAGLSLGGKQLLSDTSTGMPVISGGGTSTATFEFQTTTEDDAFLSDVQNACSSSRIKANTQGRVEGLILGSLVNKIGEVKIKSTNCTFPEGGNNIEDPGNGDNSEDDSSPAIGGSEGEIIIEDSPTNDGTASFRLEGEYDAWLKSFDWNLGDGESKSGRAVDHTYDSGGEYNVTCTVTDQGTGNTIGGDEITVTVNDLSQDPSDGRNDSGSEGNIIIQDGPTSDGTTSFTLEGEYNAWLKSFNWEFGDGQTASGRSVEHSYDSAGQYNVSCTVVDQGTGNRIGGDTTVLTVNSVGGGQNDGGRDDGDNGDTGGGEAGNGELIIENSPQDDGSARYTVEGTYNAVNVRFNWEMGDGTSKRGRTVTHTYNENDRYDVSCEVIDGVFGGTLDYMETSVRVTGLESGGGPGESEGPRSIEVLEEPGRDGRARFRMGGEYQALLKSFIWDMDESDTNTFREDLSGREVEYQFENGTYLVRCRVTDRATGEILAEDSEEIVV
jgi:plastocyanin